jgi:sporulation protein YtfJ
MSETKMSEIIKASLDGIRDFSDTETVIGNAITTPSGVTVIPVSKITIGLATGGIDYGAKKFASSNNFGGGGGTGISITPVAFLVISGDDEVRLIPLEERSDSITRIADLIERSPEIIEKIKNTLT